MKMLRTLVLLITTSFVITSCQKEESFAEDSLNNPPGGPGGGNINVVGTWRFVGMSGVTGTSMEITESGTTMKMDGLLDFIAKNPTGTYTFTSNRATSTNVGYLLSGTNTSRVWLDGSLVEDFTEDIEQDTPPSSSATNYVKIGNDSLKFDRMPLTMPDADVPVGPGIEMGAKLRMSNDTLYMRFRFDDRMPFIDPSMSGTMQVLGDVTIALKK